MLNRMIRVSWVSSAILSSEKSISLLYDFNVIWAIQQSTGVTALSKNVYGMAIQYRSIAY